MIGWNRDALGYYKEKYPSSNLDYGHDWSDWAEPADTIATSVWDVGVGLTKGLDGINGMLTYVMLSGGTGGTRYSVTNTVTWASGRIVARPFSIVVRA